MAGIKILILVNAEVMEILKEAPHDTLPAKHEKIAASVPVHLLGLEVQVDNNIPSLVKQEVS